LKQLVVNADDVGLARGMTRGALEAARRGVVTSVSVAAVGDDVDGALGELARMPEVGVGAHLGLVGERPLSPSSEVASLVAGDGRLLPSAGAFVARYLRGGVRLEEVRVELRRQVERLLERGVKLDHLDSHQHVHALPRIFDEVVALAQEHRIPFVRVPSDSALGLLLTPRAIGLRVLRLLAERCRRRLRGGVRSADAIVGLAAAGQLTPARLRDALRGEWSGCRELVCHPGEGDVELAARYRWRYEWDAEREALCDPTLPAWLREQGIELTPFERLARPVASG